MNKHFKYLSILAAITLFIMACSIQAVQAQPGEPAAPKVDSYQAVLGKSLKDREAADFLANINCSPADQFQLCKDAGIAFWTDSDQIVKVVYLYAGDASGFRRFRGQLPYGLSFYDPMWRVQEKLSNPDTDNTLQ